MNGINEKQSDVGGSLFERVCKHYRQAVGVGSVFKLVVKRPSNRILGPASIYFERDPRTGYGGYGTVWQLLFDPDHGQDPAGGLSAVAAPRKARRQCGERNKDKLQTPCAERGYPQELRPWRTTIGRLPGIPRASRLLSRRPGSASTRLAPTQSSRFAPGSFRNRETRKPCRKFGR